MRLYRMELYKLCHRASFGVWSICSVLVIVFYCWAQMDCETSTVKGECYYGYEAVKIDRKITEEYQGVLTDGKISRIVEEYGLPSEVVYDYPGWRDGNYLNNFVADYLSDGDTGDWVNYKVPTKVYAIADTPLGELQRMMGGEIHFAYTNGWKAFLDLLQIGMVLASVLVVFAVSIVFAQEGQTGMLPLLFTAKEGREKDVWAKIAAAFTLAMLVYGAVVALCLLLCLGVYGLDGAGCPLCVALAQNIFGTKIDQLSCVPVGEFAGIIMGWNLLAILFLCAITLCVSAHYKSTFGAVSLASVLWGMPVLVRMFFGGIGYFTTSCMPVFLIMTMSVYEFVSWGWEPIMLALIIPLFVLCVEEGYRVYRKQ